MAAAGVFFDCANLAMWLSVYSDGMSAVTSASPGERFMRLWGVKSDGV